MAFSTTPTEGNDRLRATAANQTINALAGHDWIRSTFNASTLYGGLGHDRIEVTLGLPDLSDPVLSRSATLFGGDGNDWMVSNFSYGFGEGLTSRQSGGNGDDIIFISARGEGDFYRESVEFEVYGGSGADDIWIEVSERETSNYNFVDAGADADIVRVFSEFGGEEGSTFNEIEAGDGDDDVLVSSSAGFGSGGGGSSVAGGEGNDRLETHANGVGGTNTLDGGAGDDTLIATSVISNEAPTIATSTASGGDGNDTIELSSTVLSEGANVVHRATGDAGDDIITSFTETGSLEGGSGASADTRLDGGAGNDVLTATTIFGPNEEGQGGARLFGRTGNDILRVYGGVENTLDGGAGDDTITGGSGADRIIGGPGADAMRGGAGNDAFVLLWADAATPTPGDTIFDFGVGTAARGDDVIDLSAIDANVNRNGNQAFTFGGPTQTWTGRVWVEENPDTAGSLVMANTGGAELLVIAVEDWASRDASDWRASDFVL